MEEQRGIDLTYITERIINLFSPPQCPEGIYLQNLQEIILMLQSKHGHKYMVVNLSQQNVALTRMNHKVLDTGWVDYLAPSLDQIFSVYKTMENWLQAHSKHIVVLHCRGDKGRLGVLVASYIHISSMLSSADLCLHHFAMRRFYNDKLSALMTPSQKRCVWMLGSLSKGGLRMCPSPSFLLCVMLCGLPKLKPDGGCSLFLRVYQSLQAVCTSPVYHVNAAQTDRLYIVLQPAQLLKGDILVVCYDKDSRSACRQVVFRLQFHTGLVRGHTLTFPKADLDCASQDGRFPDDGKVELFLSDSPERITGREMWHNARCVTMDYDTLDPLVRRDSYQDNSSSYLETAPHHVQHLGNDSFFSRVRKRSSEEQALFSPSISSLSFSDRAASASSDSGLSVASQGRTGPPQGRGATRDRSTLSEELVSGVEISQPLLEIMTELAAFGRGEGEVGGDESGLGHTINGQASSGERETDILDDGEEDDNVVGVEAHVSETPSSSSPGSLCSENLPKASEYSTHSWVRQQQMVDASPDTLEERPKGRRARPPPLLAPVTPARGLSSREAVQRVLVDEEEGAQDTQPNVSAIHTLTGQEEDLASLTTDVDESIEQLNQLILDLDPTFVPVPNSCAPLSRSASLHTNGLSHRGATHLSGWRQQKQVSDLVDYAGLHSPGWRGGSVQSFRGSPVYSPPYSPTQHGHLYKNNSVDYRTHTDGSDVVVPSTPGFPVSPPTPYVKHFAEFSQLKTGGEWDQHSWTQGTFS